MDIKSVIKKHGFTQRDVAAQMIGQTGKPVSPASLAFSIGENGNPTIGLIRQIANVIGADITEFFEDENPPVIQNNFIHTITFDGKRYGLVPLDD